MYEDNPLMLCSIKIDESYKHGKYDDPRSSVVIVPTSISWNYILQFCESLAKFGEYAPHLTDKESTTEELKATRHVTE